GIGYSDSFSTLEAFAPLADGGGDELWFADGRFMVNNATKGSGMLGFGRRVLLGDQWILGTNLYYDVRDTGLSTFQQLGGGIELLGDWFDLRGNYYMPGIADTRDELGNRFQGTRLLLDRAEVAMRGADVEVGVTLPPVFNTQTRIHAGLYHFGGSGAEDVNGWKARAEVALPGGFTVDATVNDDDTFGQTLIVGVAFRWLQAIRPAGPQPDYPGVRGFRNGYEPHISRSVRDRLAEPVERLQNIVVTIDDGTPAIDPATGQVLNILHVSNTGNSDGSFENPYQTFAQALADPRAPGGIIYTPHGGTFTEDLNLVPGVHVLSNAPLQFVQTQLGQQMLPLSGVNPDLSNLPSRIVGNVVLADRNVIDGFAVTGGISGAGVRSANIMRNRISNNLGVGINLTAVDNAGDRIVIADNIFAANGLAGVTIDGTTVNADLQRNVADNQVLSGFIVTSQDFGGVVVGNRAESNLLTGISLSGTNTVSATVSNNVTNGNLVSGIFISNTDSFSGVISDNTANGNQGNGNNQAGGVSVFATNFTGNITGNSTNFNLVPGLLVVTTNFTGDVSSNTATTNVLGGLGIASTTFSGNISNNSTTTNLVNGMLLAVGQMNGAISGNTATANVLEGIQVFFGSNGPSTVGVTGNTLLGNNLGTSRDFFLQNTGTEAVTVEFSGNKSSNIVPAGEFNYDFSNTGAGSLTVVPEKNDGGVGSSDATVAIP
ncbi:MAG: inverse autotransporter beta domain-containing protein, partial [Planctomycetota bacterium]|nr:inverse autotransporter beta domain-containing protein [Planctomycetota bacterium]